MYMDVECNEREDWSPGNIVAVLHIITVLVTVLFFTIYETAQTKAAGNVLETTDLENPSLSQCKNKQATVLITKF